MFRSILLFLLVLTAVILPVSTASAGGSPITYDLGISGSDVLLSTQGRVTISPQFMDTTHKLIHNPFYSIEYTGSEDARNYQHAGGYILNFNNRHALKAQALYKSQTDETNAYLTYEKLAAFYNLPTLEKWVVPVLSFGGELGLVYSYLDDHYGMITAGFNFGLFSWDAKTGKAAAVFKTQLQARSGISRRKFEWSATFRVAPEKGKFKNIYAELEIFRVMEIVHYKYSLGATGGLF